MYRYFWAPAEAPSSDPIERVFAVDGNRTSMRVASVGYGSDEESLAMRRFFESGNQETIDNIRRHFAPSAPVHGRP